jgi:hypothetical protein
MRRVFRIGRYTSTQIGTRFSTSKTIIYHFIGISTMAISSLLIIVGCIGILIGTITDIKKREVADWVNFSMLAAGIGLRLLESVVLGEWISLFWGAIGFIIAFGIANAMYYTGQWGGGDAKMIMALGVLFATYQLPINYANNVPAILNVHTPLVFFITFFVFSMIMGAVLGIFYTIYKAIQHKKLFVAKWQEITKTNLFSYTRYATLILVVLLILLALFGPTAFQISALLLAAMLIAGFYMMVFVRTVERSCMIEQVMPTDLVEGDWINEDVTIDGKRITGPKDLGIREEQIKTLKEAYKDKKITTVAVKVGMPLVPAFLLGLVVTILIGHNLLALFF